eukprot:jgi/Chlat1/5645/Chrsp369S05388
MVVEADMERGGDGVDDGVGDGVVEEEARPFPVRSKAAGLPVRKEAFGYTQSATYRHPDMHHEDVLEIESPFAMTAPAATQSLTFLLLGDQNAGKSTFMHAFAHSDAAEFLQLSSFLPILSSSFQNTRFLPEDSGREPLDEPPFLDTDIGQATVLMTINNFTFFANEFGIDVATLISKPDVRYVVIQFMEVGGDHLDQLMAGPEHAHSHAMMEILHRSLALLRDANRTAYFINCSTITHTINSKLSLNEAALSTLIDRMDYLNNIMPAGHEVLLIASRLPPAASIDAEFIQQTAQIVKEVASIHINIQSGDTHDTHVVQPVVSSVDGEVLLGKHDAHPLPGVLLSVLRGVGVTRGWRLRFVDAVSAYHVKDAASGEVDARAVVATLVRLFANRMVHANEEKADAIVATHVIKCSQMLEPTCVVSASLYKRAQRMWIDADVFYEYVSDLEFSELPESTMLQLFNQVANKLVSSKLALRYFAEDHSRIRLRVTIQGVTETRVFHIWPPDTDDTAPQVTHPDAVKIRLPSHETYLGLIAAYVGKQLPGEFWLSNAGEKSINTPQLQPIICDLQRLALIDFQSLVDGNTAALHEFITAVEEWSLASSVEASDMRKLCLPDICLSVEQHERALRALEAVASVGADARVEDDSWTDIEVRVRL